MRIAPAIELTPDQRSILEAQGRSRSLPARVVEHSRFVLLAAAGNQGKEIARSLHLPQRKSPAGANVSCSWGWSGLEKDTPRPGRTPKIAPRMSKRVVEMTTRQKPANATYWSTRTMAQATSISEASVRRVWRAHGLKPHLLKTFKINNNPEFAEKLEDIVGLYLNPSEHALVLCVDEK
jgi:hypothetical protein